MAVDISQLSLKEIVVLAKGGDTSALEFIFAHFENYIHFKRFQYYLPGASTDDLFQEARIGLWKAIKKFKPGYGYRFRPFAQLCILRNLKTAVRFSLLDKHSLVNKGISLTRFVSEEKTLIELVSNEEPPPDESLVERDTLDEHMYVLKSMLTEKEYVILGLRLQSFSYTEIAKELGITEKAVDNALFRVRKKVRRKWGDSHALCG